ncbi:MAG: hypothetical protein S4CHLAM102_03230 [Chlamydiia bacterium]|nr:hypothetical protein [Chlamydiia bacterium]
MSAVGAFASKYDHIHIISYHGGEGEWLLYELLTQLQPGSSGNGRDLERFVSNQTSQGLSGPKLYLWDRVEVCEEGCLFANREMSMKVADLENHCVVYFMRDYRGLLYANAMKRFGYMEGFHQLPLSYWVDEHFFKTLQEFDSLPVDKMVVYHELLDSKPDETLTSLLHFLSIQPHSMEQYAKSRWQRILFDQVIGSAQRAQHVCTPFHIRQALENYFKEHQIELYLKYCSYYQ